jgi:hypothetical protein
MTPGLVPNFGSQRPLDAPSKAYLVISQDADSSFVGVCEWNDLNLQIALMEKMETMDSTEPGARPGRG